MDRAQLYPALQALLHHEDSIARGGASRTFNKLTDADVVALLPDIVKAIQQLAPSNEMFADGVRLAGLDLISRLHLREGMELCVSTIEPDRWGEKNRTKDCLKLSPALRHPRQGDAAKTRRDPSLPREREEGFADHLQMFDQGVAAIESATATPTLVELADFKTRSSN